MDQKKFIQMIKMTMNRLAYAVLFLLMITSYGCSNKSNDKQMTIQVKNTTTQPIYELFIDARGCYFEIYVNDVPVYFHYNIGATAFRLPINSFIIRSGEQKISLKMLSVNEGKLFPQGAEVSLTIDEYPKGQGRERKTVFFYKTKPFDEKDTGIFSDERSFVSNVPYELTDWRQGVDLAKENSDSLRQEIEKKYIEYTEVFKNADLGKYKELTKLRQENIFTSMYYTEEQKKQAEKSYVSGIENNKVKLYPLEKYKLVFYGNGKLAGLRKKDDAPGIFIDNEDEKEAFMEYILFYKENENSSLEIVF